MDKLFPNECKLYVDFRFHKHSVHRGCIYYRCSDKKCSARFHFCIRSKELCFTRAHRDSAKHQPVVQGNAITVNQLVALGTDKLRSAVIVHNTEHSLEVPSKRIRAQTVSTEKVLRWVGTHTISELTTLCKKVIEIGLGESFIVMEPETSERSADPLIVELYYLNYNQEELSEFIHLKGSRFLDFTVYSVSNLS